MPVPEEPKPDWLVEQTEDKTVRSSVARPRYEDMEPPSWLAPTQPTKREWSPARDRTEAADELRQHLEDQRRRMRRSLLWLLIIPFRWPLAIAQAIFQIARSRQPVDLKQFEAESVGYVVEQAPSVHPTAPPRAPRPTLAAAAPAPPFAPPAAPPVAPPAAHAPPQAPTVPPLAVEWPPEVKAAPPTAPTVPPLPAPPAPAPPVVEPVAATTPPIPAPPVVESVAATTPPIPAPPVVESVAATTPPVPAPPVVESVAPAPPVVEAPAAAAPAPQAPPEPVGEKGVEGAPAHRAWEHFRLPGSPGALPPEAEPLVAAKPSVPAPAPAPQAVPVQPEVVAQPEPEPVEVVAPEPEPEPMPEAEPAPVDMPLTYPEPVPAAPKQPRLRVIKGLASAVMERAGEIQNRKDQQREQERAQILAAVRAMSWHGYQSMVADIFRWEGYEVTAAEGPDADAIDMEVSRGVERMLVNCQLRELQDIPIEPLQEMHAIAARNGANGAFLLTDGSFSEASVTFASDAGLVLIAGDTLVDLVIQLTLGAEEKKKKSKRGFADRLRRTG